MKNKKQLDIKTRVIHAGDTPIKKPAPSCLQFIKHPPLLRPLQGYIRGMSIQEAITQPGPALKNVWHQLKVENSHWLHPLEWQRKC